MRLLAIDPGPVESAYVMYDTSFGKGLPRAWDKVANLAVLDVIEGAVDAVDVFAVEMIASYGMAVGAEVFLTCLWIGRAAERWSLFGGGREPRFVFRRDVKLHLCGNSRAKDANIRQALIDRYGGKETAIGRKAAPGPLYGMKSDCWAALAVAITAAETASL